MRALNLFLKRVIDVITSLVALSILLPLILIIALIIKIDSPGPVLFYQRRVGINAKLFNILKFRSMSVGAEQVKNGLQVKAGDSRITPFGRFLRKTSLDEIPQFINVLKGDISLVGPRPGLPEQLKYFTDEHKGRLKMKPGITGLATVQGRCAIPWSKRIEIDLKYINDFSLLLDLKIIYKTVFVVLSGKNTYYDHSNGPAFDLANPDDLPQADKIDVKGK